MNCSRYVNPVRVCWRLKGDPLEKVDCLCKYMGSQVVAEGGCEWDVVHRMNEGYETWGALKSVLSNVGHCDKFEDVSI